MYTYKNQPANLIEAIWPASKEKNFLRNLTIVLVGNLALFASAKLQIPFWPVPITMQTYVVLVIGMAFGPRLGLATILLYLLEGAAGLPVFAGTPARGIGLSYLVGPTGGYLFGFVMAGGLLSLLCSYRWDRSYSLSVVAMFIGSVTILTCGFLWLASIVGAEKAWMFGVAPFIAGEALKIILAAVTLPALWRVIRKQ